MCSAISVARTAGSVRSLDQLLSSMATPEASEILTRTRQIAEPAPRRNTTTVSWLFRSCARLITTIAPIMSGILDPKRTYVQFLINRCRSPVCHRIASNRGGRAIRLEPVRMSRAQLAVSAEALAIGVPRSIAAAAGRCTTPNTRRRAIGSGRSHQAIFL
jgi:hypothetical protein